MDPRVQVSDGVPRTFVIAARPRPMIGLPEVGASGLGGIAGAGVGALAGGLWLAGALLGGIVAGLWHWDWVRRPVVLVPTLDQLTLQWRGRWSRRTRRLPWRSLTVMGRDSVSGGVLLADARTQWVFGEALAPGTVDWLLARLQAYLPDLS